MNSKLKKGLICGLATAAAALLAAVPLAGCKGGAPEITFVTLAQGENAVSGKTGETHKVVYGTKGDVGSISVAVTDYETGKALTAGTDYTYNEADETIVFKAAGKYTVTVSGSAKNTKSSSGTVQIVDFARPTFDFSLASETAEVDVGVSMTIGTVTYDTGDSAKADGTAYTVEYRANEAVAYATAETDSYTISDNTFTAKNLGYYRVTVSVTSAKGVTGTQFKVIKVASTENEDVGFGITYDRLIASLASGLYHIEGLTNVEYAVEEYDLTGSGTPTAEIGYVADNRDMPYLIVNDFDNNDAVGTVTVKLTAIDSLGNAYESRKTFTVDNSSVGDYFAAAMEHYGKTDNALDISEMTTRYRENACITKDGVILNRSNANWLESADFGRIYVVDKGETAYVQTEWQIDYKVTLYGFVNDNFEIKHYVHVGDGKAGVGNIDVKKAAGGEIDSWAWITTNNGTGSGSGSYKEDDDNPYMPQASSLPTLYVRFTRTIDSESGKVKLTCWFSETGADGSYKRIYSLESEQDAYTAKNFGAPTNYLRLVRGPESNAGSCYAIEDVKVTILSTGAPVVGDVTLTATSNEGYVNGTYTVDYTVVPADTNVTISVKKGDADAANTDYTYNSDTKVITFLTAGSYTVTATPENGTAKTSEAITIKDPEVTAITVTGGSGHTNEAYTVNYTVAPEGTAVTISVKKGGSEATENTDYTYDSETKVITFLTAGSYTVTATPENGTAKTSEAITISIPGVSSVLFSVDTAEEGDQINVTIETDISGAATTLTVLNSTDSSQIEEEKYIYADNKISFKEAGSYIVRVALADNSAATKDSAAITISPATLTVAFDVPDSSLTNGWYRMAANSTDTNIPCAVTGYTANYDVAYTVCEASQDAGNVKVNFTAVDTYTLKITYTNKTVTSTVYEATLNVSAVSDLTNSPVLAEDPFDGTPDELLPSLATLLYHKAYKADNTTELGDSAIVYTIANNNVTETPIENKKLEISIGNTNTHNIGSDHPFILVGNFENNSANGTVTVKMTVTDGDYTAAASKTFTVTATNETSATDAAKVNAYLQKVFPGTPLRADNMSFDHRQNLVLTKNGFMVSRHVEWGGGSWGEFAQIQVTNDVAANPVNNFQLDFDYEILMKKDDKTELQLFAYTGEGEVAVTGDTAIYNNATDFGICAWWGGNWGDANDGSFDSVSSVNSSKATAWDPSTNEFVVPTNPQGLTVGTKIHIRLIHRVVEGQVRYEWYHGAYGNTTSLTPWYCAKYTVSTTKGNYGAPVSHITLKQVAGAFTFENVTLVNLDA